MKTRDKKNLHKQYVKLRGELIRTIENSDCEVDVAGDAIDKLQGASLLRVQNQLCRINITKLRALERAIDRIDTDEFGDCEECGEEIGLRRLEALPGINICVSCAEKAEHQK